MRSTGRFPSKGIGWPVGTAKGFDAARSNEAANKNAISTPGQGYRETTRTRIRSCLSPLSGFRHELSICRRETTRIHRNLFFGQTAMVMQIRVVRFEHLRERIPADHGMERTDRCCSGSAGLHRVAGAHQRPVRSLGHLNVSRRVAKRPHLGDIGGSIVRAARRVLPTTSAYRETAGRTTSPSWMSTSHLSASHG